MSEKTNCSGNCASCSSNCGSREKQSLIEPTGEFNNIKNVVAVVSGKGGVGKSMVTSMLAVMMSRRGYKVGILDADITGPSIPKSFGIINNAMQNEIGILPAVTKTGIKIHRRDFRRSQRSPNCDGPLCDSFQNRRRNHRR